MRFDELELEDEILDGLYDMNFQEMTPVQEHTIPVILEGRDIIGCAQTGTGKTAAYTLPLLNRLLLEGNEDNVIKSVIIVPTRELAQQIDQQFQGFSYYLPISTTVVYGGGDGKGWDVQKRGMLMGSDVVIATPGRMISHIQNSGIDLSHVECLILDEADRMLDMGFSEDIMKIVSYMPKERQTIMFSATLPPKIRELAKTILRNPAEVNIAISKPNEAIDQSAYVCYENQKLDIIREMFAEPTESKTIIFSSSKMKVKELAHTLKRMKLNVAAMHSDLEQAQRDCKDRFRKDILFRMKDDIFNARRQFRELNKVMEQLTYGEEVYRFELEPSRDPQLAAFYQVIVDKGNQQMTEGDSLDNLAATADPAYERQVDELMEKIMADVDENTRARQEGRTTSGATLSDYVDYRTYLDYDIKVTNTVSGQQAYLSRVSRDSSGGENQAPFYVAICASLLQIYQKSENSIRLVLLDEAFSKMTSDRIRPMMELFRRLQLQVLLISTVEKSTAIQPYCDITYSIVRHGDANAIAPFVRLAAE